MTIDFSSVAKMVSLAEDAASGIGVASGVYDLIKDNLPALATTGSTASGDDFEYNKAINIGVSDDSPHYPLLQIKTEIITDGGESVYLDLTKNIAVPTYQVYQKDIYEEDQDGNDRYTRDVTRQRVVGKLTLMFENQSDYPFFWYVLDSLKSTGDDGYGGAVPAIMYVNNKNMLMEDLFYFDSEPALVLPYIGLRKYAGINIEVSQI